MPVIGYLYAGSPEATANFVAAFGKGLSEAGYIEGRNVAIEYRWARNDIDRLPELVGDLVRRRVTAIVTPGSIPAARAAKVATESIPIVFSTGGDPVQAGLVSKPQSAGRRRHWHSFHERRTHDQAARAMHELVPGAARFAVLVNPDSLAAETMITDLRAAASAIGQAWGRDQTRGRAGSYSSRGTGPGWVAPPGRPAPPVGRPLVSFPGRASGPCGVRYVAPDIAVGAVCPSRYRLHDARPRLR